jgi:hypothetical protein
MTRAEVDRLYRATVRNGGATWAPGVGDIGQTLTSGYGMGAAPGTFRRVRRGDRAGFRRAIAALRRAYPGHHIGTWADGPHVYIDPALVVEGPLETAVEEARSRGQIAVYSFKDKTVHSTGV